MVWNRKQQLLAVVMLCVTGCASSNYNGPRQPFAKSPQRREIPVNVSDPTPPQILPSTHFAAGRMFEAHGQLDKAIVQYRKAIAVSHSHVPSYHHLGLLLSKLQKHDEAIEMLRKAVELQPDNAALRNNLGFELMFRQRWSEAAAHLTKAIALEPRFARAQINLGMTLSKVGKFDDALAHFRAVLPEPDALYNLGLMYRAAQRYADAADAFHRALERDPKFRAAQTQLADIAPHLSPKTKPTTEATLPMPVLATETVETPKSIAVVAVPPCEPDQDMMTPDTSRRQIVAEAPANVTTATPTQTVDSMTPEPIEPAYEYGPVESLFPEEPNATFITSDFLAAFGSYRTSDTVAAVSATDDMIDVAENPCSDEDQISMMIQTGTLPTAPVNMLHDESEWLTDEAYEEEVDFTGAALSIMSTEIEPEGDPCENEEYFEDDLIGLAITEMNAAMIPVPTDLPVPAETVATPRDEEIARMPFGPLNDEVAQIDNEMRCLLEEALEAIAQAPDVQSEPLLFDPIATPSADESIMETVVTDTHEPAVATPLAIITPEVPATHDMTIAITMPSTTRHQVVAQTPPTNRVVPAAATGPLPLDWRSRMRHFEQYHVAIRGELDCLEQLDEELSRERLATAVVESPPQRDVILAADRMPTEKPSPRVHRSRRSRRTRMTMAYKPTETMTSLAAPPTQSVARRRMPVVIHDANRTEAIPLMIARPAYESDLLSAAEIGPAVPTQMADFNHTGAARQTNRTPQGFNWSRQFGDLEDMTSVTRNEIRCFEDMEQMTDLNQTQLEERPTTRDDNTRVTPVRYNGRRNPFYEK